MVISCSMTKICLRRILRFLLSTKRPFPLSTSCHYNGNSLANFVFFHCFGRQIHTISQNLISVLFSSLSVLQNIEIEVDDVIKFYFWIFFNWNRQTF